MTPLPPSVRLVLDRSVRRYGDGHVLVGGAPLRALRLSARGKSAVADLLAGVDAGEAGRRLGRRLVDAGIAQPCPARGDAAAVTIVVPVRDRADELARCLAALGSNAPVMVVDDGSVDLAAVAALCSHHGARLVRRERSGGPAAARNAGLAAVATELVAFVDSDCAPTPGWLEALIGHFEDPLVGAVAPRVAPTPPTARASVLERYRAARSPLDMGPRARRVVPGGPVSYVPAAALVVRRRALERPFDERLRYGEDVDLVWRLHDSGWRVRYEPAATVHHAEPRTWTRLLRRRWRYGTSAAPLARRHPQRLAPLVTHPAPAVAVLALVARRPLLASAAAAAHATVVARRTRGTGLPTTRAIAWSATAVGQTLLGFSRAAATLGAPVAVAALRTPRGRRAAPALLAVAPLYEWSRRRPALDPLRWTLACLADDAAYGLGLWCGCMRHRTARPLLPRRGG
jgi:mycofactocin glycosyltransferase